MKEWIGKPLDRVDGRLKVTGQAKYAAEFNAPGLLYGVTVQSTIGHGTLVSIDTTAAKAAPGVVEIMTYANAPRLKPFGQAPPGGSNAKLGEKNLLPLQDPTIHYNGQHVAVVIAHSFEEAEYAAGLLRIQYSEQPGVYELEKGEPYLASSFIGRKIQFHRGNAADALAQAPVRMEQTYTTPGYHHNPMEPHATMAFWEGDTLTVYDATQSVDGSREAVARVLGIPAEKVRLLSPFLGGGFGCKGFTWPHTFLAPMAAKLTGHPVRIVLDRQQMFTSNGRRSRTVQNIKLGAEKDGTLTSIQHDTLCETSFVDEFVEPAGLATTLLYASPNLDVTHHLVKVNKGTPCPTRAPGEATGTFAVEVAMDELAYALKMDPIELRLRNYAEQDPDSQRPWSAKFLRDCYTEGAAAFGWSHRQPEPRSMREGRWWEGYGMATATYPANRVAASAAVRLFPDGRAIAACCTQDIGTGTYTIMTQIVADALGLPPHQIQFKLGDTNLPKGPGSGGSQTAASVGPAVQAAALDARSKAIRMAIADKRSPLFGLAQSDIEVEDGRLFARNATGKQDSYAQLITRNRLPLLEGEASTNVSTREKQTPPFNQYSFHSFGAMFARVLVDPLTGVFRVTNLTACMDIGRVLNLKTARNQLMGGMIFALGMAKMEESVYDPRNGRPVTRDLANYHVPVHADIPEFDIRFLDRPDPIISPIGARGIGEIGITGTTAAIVNAVFHATGLRIRDLPITPDKLYARIGL